MESGKRTREGLKTRISQKKSTVIVLPVLKLAGGRSTAARPHVSHRFHVLARDDHVSTCSAQTVFFSMRAIDGRQLTAWGLALRKKRSFFKKKLRSGCESEARRR